MDQNQEERLITTIEAIGEHIESVADSLDGINARLDAFVSIVEKEELYVRGDISTTEG